MTIQQKLQHIADKQPQPYTEPVTIESTPDGLGLWEGGREELKGAKNWVSLKSHPTRTGDFKNTPGKASSQIVERSTDYFKQGNNTVAPLKIEEVDNIPCDVDEPAVTPSEPGLGDLNVSAAS
jgi:hypothetical protein